MRSSAKMDPSELATQVRFALKVRPVADGCWTWQGKIDVGGYGRFKVGGRWVVAHRYAYEWFVGLIPEGLVVDHLCRVRHCVNPDHLEAVTTRVNVLRSPTGFAAINASKTECKHGHPFDEANTMRTRWGRACRECMRLKPRAVHTIRARLAKQAKSPP